MRHLLFNLQGVSDDEAEEFRQILHEHGIIFYETSAGKWRIGLAAIWLPDTQQKEQARQLLHDYQKDRYDSFEHERQRLKRLGLIQGMMEQLYFQPVKFIAALIGIIVILSISIVPFISAFTS